jgi:predicted nucleic acid-binding protein
VDALKISAEKSQFTLKVYSSKLRMSILRDEKDIPFIDLGEGYKIRLEFEDITEDKYIEKAKLELRETPDVVATAVETLLALIKGEFARV